MVDAPVLFMFFNRPDTTKKVFEEIRKARPRKLFLASDGPRNDAEKKKVQDLREYILKNINWKCDVKKLFRERNLGCKLAVSQAITWFFRNVESGIILEDDCLPNSSFFTFCEELLKKYKNDERIMMITGTNYFTKVNIPESYLFSRHPNIWGWATWGRAWDKYDIDIKAWDSIKKKKYLDYLLRDKFATKYYEINFDYMRQKFVDTWDYQWVFACLFNNGLCITPKVNLISNIGATGAHASKKTSINFLKTYELPKKLIHPDYVFANRYYDEILYKRRKLYETKLIILNFGKNVLTKLGLFEVSWPLYKKLKNILSSLTSN